MDESAVVKKAAEGDRASFETLVRTYQKPIYNLALRMLGDENDAFDAAQEAFLKAWRALPEFRGEAKFSSWLYRLASNTCLDFLRAQKRSKVVSLSPDAEDGEPEDRDLPDPAPGPEEQTIAALDRDRVRMALNALEPVYREALTLCAINGLSYAEISEVLGVSEGTVKSRVHRARERMRKRLAEGGNNSVGRASKKKKGGV